MKAKAILISCVCEVAAILLKQNILCEVVEILILLTPITNSSIAPFDVRRSNHSAGIAHHQLLVVPPPNISVQVALD